MWSGKCALISLEGKPLSQRSPAESVLYGRAVAVTAIEHGNIIITVASVSRDPMMLRNHALAVSRVAEFVSLN
jgi:hypothetical protein